MTRPGPPRHPESNGTPHGDPAAAIAAARYALTAAEAEVARVSQDRLTQLLGQSVQQRFRHFDDPDLLPVDRVRLRASVIEADRARGGLWASLARLAEVTASRWLRRPKTIAAMLALCVGAPAALHAVTMHDADRATVMRTTHATTGNQDGMTATYAIAPGARLAVFGEGPTLQARIWNAGAGYTIYDVAARDVARNGRTPWQAVTAFAAAVHAGWSQPAARS